MRPGKKPGIPFGADREYRAMVRAQIIWLWLDVGLGRSEWVAIGRVACHDCQHEASAHKCSYVCGRCTGYVSALRAESGGLDVERLARTMFAEDNRNITWDEVTAELRGRYLDRAAIFAAEYARLAEDAHKP